MENGTGDRPGFGEGLTEDEKARLIEEAGKTVGGLERSVDPRHASVLEEETARLKAEADKLAQRPPEAI